MSEDSREDLSAILRRLRRDAGLSGREACRQAGVSQASISRWEAGRFVPSLGDVRALARVYRASPKDRRRLERYVNDLRESPDQPARLVMRRPEAMQQRVGRIEEASAAISEFQPVLFPGLIQTEDYAKAIFASGDDYTEDKIDATLAARLERAWILGEGGRRITLVLTEGVLRWPLGSSDLMAAQLEHVIGLSHRENLHVGVIPSTTPVTVAPTHGFQLYDERAAIVGTETATAFLTDPRDVAAYAKLFGELSAAAVFGDSARQLLAEQASRYHHHIAG